MSGTSGDTGNIGGGEPDAAAEPDARPIPDAALPDPDATPACTNAAEPLVDSNYHGVGQLDWGLGGDGCLGSCHNGSGEVATAGRKLTIGGRVYNRRTVDGAQPVRGAHVYIIDADGQVLDLITDSVGKFWYDGEVAFPVKTYASGCPDSIPMVAPSANGNCQSGTGGACHDASNRIYLNMPLDPPAPL